MILLCESISDSCYLFDVDLVLLLLLLLLVVVLMTTRMCFGR